MPSEKRTRPTRNVDISQEGTCLICATLKKFQSECVEDLRTHPPQSLCSVHTWLVAKSADAETAAKILLHILGHALERGPNELNCDMCKWVADEENRELDEFSSNLLTPAYPEWFSEHGSLCVPHARILFNQAPNELRKLIASALQKEAATLRTDLLALLDGARAGIQVHPGILGRAAEHLVGKRGLNIRN